MATSARPVAPSKRRGRGRANKPLAAKLPPTLGPFRTRSNPTLRPQDLGLDDITNRMRRVTPALQYDLVHSITNYHPLFSRF